MGNRLASVGFPLGLLYSRFTREKPAGSVEDVANLWLDRDRAYLRAGSDLVYQSQLGTGRLVAVQPFDFPNGAHATVGVLQSGTSKRFETRAKDATPVSSGLVGGATWLGSIAGFRDGVWTTNGGGRPQKYLPQAAAGRRDMWAGCPAPLMHPTDDAITCAVTYPGLAGGGLEEGHRYYGMTILYGPNGCWGESAIGALGRCVVPGGQRGAVRLTLPILGSTQIPNDLFYAGAWGRAIYRIVANDDRNGPYYRRDIIPDMTTITWVDSTPDANLDGLVRTLADDPMIPPAAFLACWCVNRMLYGRTIADPRRVWASELDCPDLVRAEFAEDMPGEALTGLFERNGAAYGLTPTSVSEGLITDTMSWRHQETDYGLWAPYSLAHGQDCDYWLSRLGPVTFRGGLPEPILGLGGVETWDRVWRDVLDHASNLEQCVGLMLRGRYLLAYPDVRDNCYPYTGGLQESLGFGTTRAVVYDPANGNWTKHTGIFLGPAAKDGERVIWAEARTLANVLGFSDDHRDYDPVAAAEHATRFSVTVGNLASGDTGKASIPQTCTVVADVQGSAAAPVYVRPVIDGTVADDTTCTKIYAGAGDFTGTVVATGSARRHPDSFDVPVSPELCREFQLQVTNESAAGVVNEVGDFALHGLEVEMKDVF